LSLELASITLRSEGDRTGRRRDYLKEEENYANTA
jgi:hypothetical protein